MANQGKAQPVDKAPVNTGRHGNRWINEAPAPDDFAEWFKKAISIDEGLAADHYLSSVIVVPAEEKIKVVTGFEANGTAILQERTQMVYSPYVRIAGRVDYWWDLIAKHGDDWVGVVENVELARLEDDSALGQINRTLPPGFAVTATPVGSAYTYFAIARCRVAIYEKPVEFVEIDDPWVYEAKNGETLIVPRKKRVPAAFPIREGKGLKQVPLLKSYYNRSKSAREYYADDTALMRVETGALGRALAAAGILTLGTGIASAEDMAEGFGQPTAVQPVEAPEQPQLPGIQAPAKVSTGAEQAGDERQQLIDLARAILKTLSDQHQDAYNEFSAWAKAKDPPIRDIGTLEGPKLRGCVKKLQSLLAGAEKKAAQDATAEAPDNPPDPIEAAE